MANNALLSVDIEIANVFTLKPGQDLDRFAPFDIAVAATGFAEGESRVWYTPGARNRPKRCMSKATAKGLLSYLAEVQDQGTRVAAWNGVGFDLQWIGHVAKNMELAAHVALRTFDPMLQFFWARGFPVGLAKVGEGMGIKQTKLMNGADAPIRWKQKQYQAVIDYVIGDVQLTNQVFSAIESQRRIRWITTKGTKSSEPIQELLPAFQVLRQPKPDQSWMTSPIDPRKFYHWMPRRIRRRAYIR